MGYAVQMDATATFYWSDVDAATEWNLMASKGWTHGVPLRLELEGTYTLYNESVKGSDEFDVLWTANSFTSSYEFIAFNVGEQSEDFFAVPALYAQCNATLFCAEYPQRFPCDDSSPSSNSESDSADESESNSEGGDSDDLSAGYIVLMIVLVLVALCVGACLDRWVVRKRGTAHFVETQTSPRDAGL